MIHWFGKRKNQSGFSLMEIMVVVAIIAVLAGVIMLNLQRARVRGRVGKAEADLGQLRTAVGLLESDTGKLPNGCPPTEENITTVEMNLPAAGLLEVPVPGVISGTCEWAEYEVSQWKGPYGDVGRDPWSNQYVFNSRYLSSCEEGSPVYSMVVMSFGEDGVQTEPFDGSCNPQTTDDQFITLK